MMSLNRMLSEWNDPQGARTMSDAEELIDALAKCCTQRGARMQIMREWMRTYPPYTFRYTTLWDEFAARKDALPWFNEDGVPVDEAMKDE